MQSVDRAVSLLQALALRGSAGLTELSLDVGIHKSTVFRLLATLEARGLVEQDAGRGRYRLGQTARRLAAGATGSTDVAASAHPIAQELATTAGETVNVVISDGQEVVTVDQVTGGAIVSSSDWVGRRAPLHATAAGKVFLAAMAPAQLTAALRAGLPRLTDATITDRSALRAQLAEVRARGWASVFEEHEVGLVVIAAPLRDADGRTVGALTLGGPSYRVNAATLPGLTELLLDAAARASWRLGHLKPG
ncbi:IclR family transcriptional regulator [Kineococcus aurantiacus]